MLHARRPAAVVTTFAVTAAAALAGIACGGGRCGAGDAARRTDAPAEAARTAGSAATTSPADPSSVASALSTLSAPSALSAASAPSASAPATKNAGDTAGTTDSRSPSPQRRCVVAAIGDSLTDARSHGGKFLDYLKERCPESRFDNYGKGGQMVNQMRRRFGADVLGEPPAPGTEKPAYTHVIVFGGINDICSDLTAKRTPKKIEDDLLLMCRAAKRRGARVVALTVAPWGGFKAFNTSRANATLEVNRWIMAQRDAGTVDHVVDTYPLLSCGDSDRLCPDFMPPFKDGLHFNGSAHAKIGEALYEQVFAGCL